MKTTIFHQQTLSASWISLFAVLLFLSGRCSLTPTTLRGTGDLGIIIERAKGSVKVINNSNQTIISSIDGLGDLSHASAVYSRDSRFAYIFGRDGGLTQIDLLKGIITKRIIQSGNSIGGAISQDGKIIAVSNYAPSGVKFFDSDSLELIYDIPATPYNNKHSKVVGLVDAPGNRFVFSLFDTNEIWIADFSGKTPEITKFTAIGKAPYDALITDDGRYYMAGLFGEDGLANLDLWHPDKGVTRILPDYGKGDQKLPVYKMPHLEGWAKAGNKLFVPAVGQHKVLVIDMHTWQQIDEIPVYGQPVFVMAQPDNRQIWVNFAFPDNEAIQIIDAENLEIRNTLKPGKGVLHMEFTARGEHVWVSVRDNDQVLVYDTKTYQSLATLKADKPSGIFFTHRTHAIGL